MRTPVAARRRRIRGASPALLGALLAIAPALAAARAAPVEAARLDRAVAEAAQASGLPEAWILSVIRAESGGDPAAVSRAGAIGLMQLMPSTWRELAARLGLGPDPFDVRDNVLAGAVYLRDMLDRFGPEGFLAAYNAGPARYAAHLAGRGPLPAETRAYVARLQAQLGASDPRRAGGPARDPFASGLFPQRPSAFGSADGLFGLVREAQVP